MDNLRIMPSSPPASAGADSPVAGRRLITLRWWLLAGEALAILAVPPVLDIPLPRAPMLVVVALQVVANGIAARRQAGAGGIEEGQLFVQLVTDIVALSVLMFLSGGAANPLISFLLPPVAFAALALPPWRVAVVAGLAVLAYSLLNLVFLPLPIADAGRAARLHLAGMWFTFVLSVAMLAWFVVRMTASIRARDAELAAAREQALRDERVVALGTLAAGAAHELSTPLATMAIIAGELESDERLAPGVRADIALLRKQVVACKGIISGLAERAGAGRLDSAASVPAAAWLTAVHSRWRELRPRARSELDVSGVPPPLTFVADATLEQGVANLLNNAADAGRQVKLRARQDGDWLEIEVRDDGEGFPAHVLGLAGKMPFPAHAGGSGIGLFLARAAIVRLGGELILCNDGGGVARVRLPLGTTS